MTEESRFIQTVTCPVCAVLIEVPSGAGSAAMTAAVIAHELAVHGVSDEPT